MMEYEGLAEDSVTDLVLVNKRASAAHVMALDALVRRHLGSITRIDLSYNYLRNSGVISLALLIKALPRLSHLDLGDNHVGDSGASAVAEAAAGSTALATLALGGNRIGDAGLSAVAAQLPLSLHTLNFNFNCASNEGAAALAGRLQRPEPPNALTCLYLSGNSISGPGVAALADAARRSGSLRQLYLRGNPLDEAARAELEQVARQTSLLVFV